MVRIPGFPVSGKRHVRVSHYTGGVGFIYATGWFGLDRGGLIRIHADGQLDNSLPLTVAGSGEALQLQADGSLLLAGVPGSVLGRHRSGVAALALRDDHLFADGFQP